MQTNDTAMNAKSLIARLVQQEDINFLFSNRIPRGLATRFMGWLSRIEQPWVCGPSIALWRLFSDLDLSEAKADPVQEPARLLYAGTQGGCASH